jgi:hypothetical protein
MKPSKLFAVCLTSLLLLKPSYVARACWYEPEDFFTTFSFFDPSLAGLPDFSALYYSFVNFYDYTWNSQAYRQQDNLEAWQAYTGQNIPTEDIAAVVLALPQAEMAPLITWMRGKGSLPDTLAGNRFARYLKESRRLDLAYYLDFAKRCEPQVYVSEWGWEDASRDEAQMARLQQEALDKYAASVEPFLKGRYAYQALRLAHYAGRYEDCLRIFDEKISPLKDRGLIYYWSLGHKAGALQALGRHPEANYLFSLVFEHCRSKRVPAWLSIRNDEEQDWEATLALCKTPQEKATLYLIRAIHPSSPALSDMEAIYRLDPRSEKLELLLAREVNKLEQDLFHWDFDFQLPIQQEYENGMPRYAALDYLAQVAAFTDRLVEEQRTARPEYWRLALGYLRFMQGEYGPAQEAFAALRASKTPQVARMAAFFDWVLRLNRLEQLDGPAEEAFYNDMRSFWQDEEEDAHQLGLKADRFLRNTFARLYAQSGRKGMAFLALKGYYELKLAPDAAVVEELIAWLQGLKSREATDFEVWMMEQIHPQFPLETLLEMKATLLLRQGQWQAAADLYAQVPEELYDFIGSFRIPLDPFEGYTWDCVNCFDLYEASEFPYTRLRFAQEMASLEAQARARPSAELYYRLGNAAYNMTYFGPAWMLASYYRSGGSLYLFSPDYEPYGEESKSELFTDMARPEAYYRKAVSLTKDRELAAKALFMAAKCRQNQFYLDGKDDYEHLEEKKPYRKDFETLHKQYAGTRFYREIIGECGYLATWAADR